MRAKSARAAAKQRARVTMLKARTHGPVRCQWPTGCPNEAVDPDELLTRGRGGDPADPDNVWLLCRTHHDWKHAHPVEARAMGVMPSQHDGVVSHAVQPVSYTPSMAKSPQLAVRIPQAADDWISRLATSLGATRTVVVRAMLREATEHPEAVQRRIKAYLAGTL